ncbi:MAG: hypothetical protein J0L76_03755 [Rhodobacterales bacterium]|nr:hypothetical protein [Rhodobacterales bacterium]
MKQAAAGLLAALMALSPVPAVALSCEEYSIRDAYWRYQAAEETYVLVFGAFLDLKKTRAKAEGYPGGAEVWTAKFTGHGFSRRAFDKPFETGVTLIFPDFSDIAGGYNTADLADWLPGKRGLVWLKKTAAGYQLAAGLCQPLLDTKAANVKPALQCLRGGYCPKSN